MTEPLIVDAGPMVSFFDVRDEFHAWTAAALRDRPVPFITCEAAIAEATYLLRSSPSSQDELLGWLTRGALAIEFDLGSDSVAVRRLMRKYRVENDVPQMLIEEAKPADAAEHERLLELALRQNVKPNF